MTIQHNDQVRNAGYAAFQKMWSIIFGQVAAYLLDGKLRYSTSDLAFVASINRNVLPQYYVVLVTSNTTKYNKARETILVHICNAGRYVQVLSRSRAMRFPPASHIVTLYICTAHTRVFRIPVVRRAAAFLPIASGSTIVPKYFPWDQPLLMPLP